MARNIRLEEQARQSVRDLYRQFPKSIVEFDYTASTARIYTDGVDEKILIFGTDFVAFSRLAYGAKKCTTEKILERMKAVI